MDLIDQAREEQRCGRYAEALTLYRSACSAASDHIEPWLARGELAAAIGAHSEAVEALYRVAQLAASTSSVNIAKTAVKRVLALEPQHAGALAIYGTLGAVTPEPQAVSATLRVDNSGQVISCSEGARAALSQFPGDWELWPTDGELLALQRVARRSPRVSPAEERRVALCGVIGGEVTASSILQIISMNAWQGELHIVDRGDTRTFFFEKGKLLSAVSSRPADFLGAFLVRMELVTHDEIEEALSAEPTGFRIGEALVARHKITAKQLYDAIRQRSEELLFAALNLEAATYYFVTPLDAAAVPASLHLSVQELLLDGLRRIDELDNLRHIVPSGLLIPTWTATKPPKPLSGDPAVFYEAIDGVSSIVDLGVSCKLDEFRATKAAAVLIQRSLVTLVSDEDLQRAEPQSELGLSIESVIAAYDSALAELFAALQSEALRGELKEMLDDFMFTSVSFEDLFTFVTLNEQRKLPLDRLRENLEKFDDGDRADVLNRGLNELVFFGLFGVKDCLGTPVPTQELEHRVARALHGSPARE